MHPVAKIPPMSSENHWEAVNVSIPESNDFDFDDESVQFDAPSVVCWHPLYAYSALTQSSPCHSSRIYPVLTVKQVLYGFLVLFV